MKTHLEDPDWHKVAQKHAKHLAHLHMEIGNAPKIAEALKEIPITKALEFLFEQAEKARKENRHKKAAMILEAATLLDRKTGEATELILEETGKGKNEDSQLFVRRYTPKEIFDTPIVFQEIIED